MTRTGKISRLPRPIREELNHRLADAESGRSLLRWLNALPEVQAVLAREFGGQPISKQNLFKWRAHGFAEWQSRRDWSAQIQEFAAKAPESAATDGKWTGHLVNLVAERYAAALMGWNGDPNQPFRQKFRTLRALCQDVVQLRRRDHHDAWLELERDQRDYDRAKDNPPAVSPFDLREENMKASAPLAPGSPDRNRPPVNPGQPQSTQVNPKK